MCIYIANGNRPIQPSFFAWFHLWSGDVDKFKLLECLLRKMSVLKCLHRIMAIVFKVWCLRMLLSYTISDLSEECLLVSSNSKRGYERLL